MKTNVTLIRDEDRFSTLLKEQLSGIFTSGERVAIKLHMGEPGNVHYIPAALTKRIADAMIAVGCHPFIFDTPVVYRSPRDSVNTYLASAASHGYSESSLGIPVVVSNRSTRVDGSLMTYGIALDVLEADGVLLLSHVKGHLASGMGGAIKNIGMGCMSKETKGAIHTGGEPVYTEGCTDCGTCVERCPTKNIRLAAGQPYFDATWCPGCSNCVLVCPEHCISPRVAVFDEAIAEAAVLAHERFKKIYAVNMLKNITKLCDCVANSGPVILRDIGFICGPDMVSVDAASLVAISEASKREDIFEEYNKRSSWGHVRAAATMMGKTTDVTITDAG
jgi:uncharacterized Fe-S center protein